MSTKYNEGDGKPVVVKDGQRVGGVHESTEAAEAEAARLKKLQEASGAAGGSTVAVKTNLYGSVILLLMPVVSVCATTCMS